jgi:hypothetical protein
MSRRCLIVDHNAVYLQHRPDVLASSDKAYRLAMLGVLRASSGPILLIADDAQQFRGVAGLTRDLEPGALQQARDALGQQDVVIRHHDALLGAVSGHLRAHQT